MYKKKERKKETKRKTARINQIKKIYIKNERTEAKAKQK